MGAPDILMHLAERGIRLQPLPDGNLKASPAGVLTDAERAEIRAHKPALVELLTTDWAAEPVTPKPVHSCATCTHCTQARTCAEPEAAGLADRFRVVWLDLIGNHGRTCTAWSESDQRQPAEMVSKLTPEQQRAVIGLDDAELQRLSRYMRRAQRHGLDLDVCERIADLLTLRDRQHDDRRMCLECSHLEPSGRCAAARSGRLAGAGRDLHPVKVVLMRCPGFTTNARD